MKNNITRFLSGSLIVICLLFMQFSCRKDNSAKTYTTRTYTIFTPIYKDRSTVLSDINGSASQAIENAGKIYIKDNFIFLNEVDKGIHVIDNRNPARPVQTAFLNIPGTEDIAVKGNTLYADMYGDLLAIDISDVKNVHVTGTLYNFFSGRTWVNGYATDSNRVITDWIKKDTTVTEESTTYPTQCDRCYFDLATASVKSVTTGVAGSMARMVLINNYLYAITEPHSIGIVNVTNAAAPSAVTDVYAGFDLETIYPFEGKLFLGSSIGLFMYDVSDPESPAKLGEFSHGRACDPVITDGKYAYVTLHTGTACGGSDNELNIIDIQDLMNPSLVKSYPMTKPGGLSKDGNLLFICDGTTGVKVYNAANALGLKLVKQIASTEPYDVITGNNTALVVAKNGLFQYDYSNPNNIRQLSVISVKN